MRKGLTTLLVILLALGAVLVSCKAEIEAPADELVAVSFEERTSRALSATLEEFNVNNYFWYYAAKKTDSTGLISGQTTTYDAAGAVAISTGDEAKGLSYFVPGFSQGTWKFTLYAYTERPETVEQKAAWVYSGEATGVVLKKNGTNMVSVTVNPNSQGDGFLFVDKEHIYLSEASDLSDNHVSPVITIEPITGETPVIIPETNVKYNAKAGTYLVTVAYTDGYITYATGDVIATVYPGLTTTVTGYVDELVTYAQFDAVENPDIVRETWGSTITNNTASVGNISLTKNETESKTTKVTSATMPAKAAVDKMNELATNVGADAGTSSMKLNLNVDTTEATETKVKYDIGMEAELTYQKNGQASTSKSDVKNIDDYVIVVINLASDITDVSVTHSGKAMIKYTDYDAFLAATVDNDALINPLDPSEGYKGFYCLRTVDDTKTLNIKTRSFSPFEVTYTMSDYVAVVGATKYTSITTAIANAPDGSTVVLLKDTSGSFNLNDGRTITLDLGGHALNGGPLMWITGDSTLKIEGTTSGSSVTGRFCIGQAGNDNGNIEINGGSYYRYGGTCLHINGECLNSNVTIRNATLISDVDNGIQLNGKGKFLIENTTITGATAIYIKAGTLTIDGGTFTGNMSPANYSYYGNGANATGDAIVVDACEYPGGNPTVIIKDGTFSGTKEAIGYYQYDANNDGIKGQATIRVEGGRYNTDPSEFVAEGYYSYKDGDWYKVIDIPFEEAGTEADPFLISSVADFLKIDTLSDAMGAGCRFFFKLTADIDLRNVPFSNSYVVEFICGGIDGKKSETESYKIYAPNDTDVNKLFRYMRDVEISNIDIILDEIRVSLVGGAYEGETFIIDNVDFSSTDFGGRVYQLAHNGSLYFTYNYLYGRSEWGGNYTLKNCDVKLNLKGASSSNSAVFVGGYAYNYGDSYITVTNCSYDGTFSGNYVALVLSNGQNYSPSTNALIITDLKNKGTLIGIGGAYAVGGQNHTGQCSDTSIIDYYNEVQATTGGVYNTLSVSVTASVNDDGKIVISNPSESYTYTVSLYAGREIYDSNNHKWASNYNYAINFGIPSADVYRYQFVDYDTAIAEGLIEASDCSDEWISTNCEIAGDGKYQIVTKGLNKYYVLKFTTDDNLYAKFVIDLQTPTVMVCAYDSSNNLVGLTEL